MVRWTNVSVVALAAGCGVSGSDDLVIRSDSAGIEIVTSPAEDRALPWTVEPRFSVGGAESGPASFYHVNHLTAAVDDSGRIFVLDASAKRIVVFDGSGEVTNVIGRAGRGPGELSTPATLAVGGDGTVHVFDYGKGAIVRFTANGEI